MNRLLPFPRKAPPELPRFVEIKSLPAWDTFLELERLASGLSLRTKRDLKRILKLAVVD